MRHLTDSQLRLAQEIDAACDQAALVLFKKRNCVTNLALTPAMALASILEKPLRHKFEPPTENMKALAALVEQTSVREVLEALAAICHANACKYADALQSAAMAKAWSTEAERLNGHAMRSEV